jgi:hypothetical protein
MRRAAIILVVLGGVLATIEYLNFSGFCYSQMRWLSDADLIRHAIQYNLQRAPTKEAGDTRYDSVEAFLDRNQNCCKVLRQDRGEFEGVLEGRWVRLFGWYILVVRVWYQIKEVGPNNFVDSSIAMTSCGQFSERHAFLTSRSRDAGGN